MRRRYLWMLLLTCFGAILLLLVNLPYLRLRLFAEATMRDIPPPPAAQQLNQEAFVYAHCRETALVTHYHTDSSWAELVEYYRTLLQSRPGWSFEANEYQMTSTWIFDPRDDVKRPSLIVRIGRLLPSDWALLQLNPENLAALNERYYRVDVEYVEDDRAYHVCHPD